jgi:hypothetical protein
MSLLAGLVRAAFPVGSARRDRLLGAARAAGVLSGAPESSYQRWQRSIEAEATTAASPNAHEIAKAVETIQFEITIDNDGRNDPRSVTRTLVSLSNQTFDNWTVRLPSLDRASEGTKRLLADAQAGDQRMSSNPIALSTHRTRFSVHLRFGDSLAASALAELACLAVRVPSANRISGEFDMIDPFSGLRSAPAAIGSWEPDLAQQFDLDAGFVAIRQPPRTSDDLTQSPDDPAQPNTALRVALVPHATNVLLHRFVGPRERAGSLLPPGRILSTHLSQGVTTEASPHRHGGLRIRHKITSPLTATIVIRDPLDDVLRAASHSQQLLATAGVHVTVSEVVTWDSGSPFPDVPTNGDVVAVVDGGLVPSEKGWLDDLVGVLQQDHVFAVAPLLAVPSGVVFDGGAVTAENIAHQHPNETSGTARRSAGFMRARSGRLDFAPYELARCRQVASLSGRAVVIRTADLRHPGDLVSAFEQNDFTQALREASFRSQRCCLVWGHQRWTLSIGLAAKPTDSPMLAWNRGRLRTWWEPTVMSHEPEPGRQGEGVW